MLGPLEVQTFFIDSTQLTGEEGQAHLGVLVPMASSIENNFLKVSLDAQTNRLISPFTSLLALICL